MRCQGRCEEGQVGPRWRHLEREGTALLTENVKGQDTGGVPAPGGAEAAAEAEGQGQASQAPGSGLLARGARRGVGLGWAV